MGGAFYESYLAHVIREKSVLCSSHYVLQHSFLLVTYKL